MKARTYARLRKKWNSSFEDFYTIEAILLKLKKAGVAIPRGLVNPKQVAGLFLCERLERLLKHETAWTGASNSSELRKELERIVNSFREVSLQPR
jgi:hypothetical protein